MIKRNPSELQRILTEKQLKTATLARAIGLSVRSIHNVSCGSSKSRAARKKIQQFLQTQLWDDVPFIREARLRFSQGDFFVFPTPAMAAEFASELGTAAEAIGRHLRIRIPVEMTFVTDGSVSDAGSAVVSAHDDGSEDAIEFWCGTTPPDSPFSPNDQIISGAAARKARTHTTRKTASKVAAATRAPEKPGARKGESE